MGREGRAYGHKISCGPFYFNERFQNLGSPSFSVDPLFFGPSADGLGLVSLGVRKLIFRKVVRNTLAFQQRLLAFN